jgi:rod shape-determining protein MreC
MELLFNRYRNLTVLLVAIIAQLGLLAYQVRDNHDVRLIRVWAVGAVTPIARVLEFGRSGTSGFFKDYVFLLDTRQENKRLKTERDTFALENQQMRAELSTADRAKELALFQQHSPQVTLAARVIGNATGGNTTGGGLSGAGSRPVIVDRGSNDGILKGMAVITPTGIVGKVTQVFPSASFVILLTDSAFSAGVISQKSHIRGVLKGQGTGSVVVDFQNESPVDVGELFFTSGDDLIFPKGLPVGKVNAIKSEHGRKAVYLTPSGSDTGLEEVLIVTRGVHGTIPEYTEALPVVVPQAGTAVMLPPPPDEAPNTRAAVAASASPQPSAQATGVDPNNTVVPSTVRPARSGGTDADRMVDALRAKGGPRGKTPPVPLEGSTH